MVPPRRRKLDPKGKPALKRTHSKRFASFGAARQGSRQRLECARFSAAFRSQPEPERAAPEWQFPLDFPSKNRRFSR
jgi:hypothetical protein